MNIILKIVQYKKLIFLIFVLTVFFIMSVKIDGLQKQLTNSQITNSIQKQNISALKDSVKQKADSLQIYHSFVGNLEDKLKIFEKENNLKTKNIALLNNKITILGDSIRFLEKQIDLIEKNKGTDSAYFELPIFAENEFSSVNGNAKFYMLTKKGSFGLTFVNKDLQIENFLSYNPKDTSVIVYTKVNNNKKILSTSTISPELYKLLIPNIKQNKTFADRFKLGIGVYLATNNFDDYFALPEIYGVYEFDYFKLKASSFYQNEKITTYIGANFDLSFAQIFKIKGVLK